MTHDEKRPHIEEATKEMMLLLAFISAGQLKAGKTDEAAIVKHTVEIFNSACSNAILQMLMTAVQLPEQQALKMIQSMLLESAEQLGTIIQREEN